MEPPVQLIAPIERRPLLQTYGPDLVALAIGALCFFVIFGADFLLLKVPFLTQPTGDVAAEMSGYFHFAQDKWRFPLFSLPMINLPEGANQLFIGGVPILALTAKIIYTVTGYTPNLFGFWYFLCFALQTHSLFFLMRQIDDKRPYLLAFMSLAGALSYAFMTRFGHVSLFGQFLTIYAMGLVIATTRTVFPAKTIVIRAALLTYVSMFVFAYLAISNTVLFGVILVSLLWLRRISLAQFLSYGAIFSVAIIGLAACGGYFWAVGKADPQDISSYGSLGTNLGSLILAPQSLIFPNNGLFTNWWEGDFYLGLAALLLWVLLLFGDQSSIFGPLKRNWPIAILIAIFVVYCLSNNIRFGDKVLLSYSLPKFLVPIVGMARAGGRLFWPIGYFLIAAAFVLSIRRFPRQAIAIVIGAMILSCAEATATYRFAQQTIRVPHKVPLDYVGLKQVTSQHNKLLVYPSFWCDPGSDDSMKRVLHWQLTYSASLTNLSSNSGIMARKVKNCERESAERGLKLDPGLLTVFTSRRAAKKVIGESPDLLDHCRSFALDNTDSGLMCSSDWSGKTTLPVPQLVASTSFDEMLSVGGVIDFSTKGNSDPLVDEGWAKSSEGELRWTSGKISSLNFSLGPLAASDLSAQIVLYPFLSPPSIPSRQVEVFVNDQPVADWSFDVGGWQTKEIRVPSGLAGKHVKIQFRQNESRSPRELGMSNDPRPLGLAFKSITIKDNTQK